MPYSKNHSIFLKNVKNNTERHADSIHCYIIYIMSDGEERSVSDIYQKYNILLQVKKRYDIKVFQKRLDGLRNLGLIKSVARGRYVSCNIKNPVSQSDENREHVRDMSNLTFITDNNNTEDCFIQIKHISDFFGYIYDNYGFELCISYGQVRNELLETKVSNDIEIGYKILKSEIDEIIKKCNFQKTKNKEKLIKIVYKENIKKEDLFNFCHTLKNNKLNKIDIKRLSRANIDVDYKQIF